MATKLSKTKQQSTAHDDRSPAIGAPDLSALAWPFEHWLRFQAELLKAAEPSLTGWMNRRHDGTTAVLRTFEKLATCRDIDEAISIQSEWLDAALRRLDMDAHAVVEHALAVSQCASGATRQVAQTTTEMAARGAEWIVRRDEPDAKATDLRGVSVNASAASRGNATEPQIATQAAA